MRQLEVDRDLEQNVKLFLSSLVKTETVYESYKILQVKFKLFSKWFMAYLAL